MAVLCEALSVIVPIVVLDEHYPGRADGYAMDVPNATFCSDGILTRVGFMNPRDVHRFCDALSSQVGLVLTGPSGFVDCAVVDELAGPTLPCAWLQFVRDEGVSRAWHADSDRPGDLATPPGWTPGHMSFISEASLAGTPLGVTSEDTASTIDYETGEAKFSTATFPEPLSVVPSPLSRYVAAQESIYDEVLQELRTGRKTGHWMWFVFPQLRGLGRSTTSRKYSIATLDEARAYLAHPVLGPRIVECATLVADLPEGSIEDAFGSLDAVKLRSSMTLFGSATSKEGVFADVIRRHFDGWADQRTIDLLGDMEDPIDEMDPTPATANTDFDFAVDTPSRARRSRTRHLGVTPMENESLDHFADRVSRLIRKHFKSDE